MKNRFRQAVFRQIERLYPDYVVMPRMGRLLKVEADSRLRLEVDLTRPNGHRIIKSEMFA